MKGWKYNRDLSDYQNIVGLIYAKNYTPKTTMNILIANILLHFEGLVEEDGRRTIKPYLENGIWRGEEGMLSDFDYE